MPRTKKTKISKTKQTKETKSKETITPYQNIINVINSLSNSRNKHSFSKSRNNLPAQLMTIEKKNKQPCKQYSKKSSKYSSKPQVFNRTFKSSSSFSSITQNGETHSEGKKVINNSLKPFIEIKEMENGEVKHYMIPRTSLSHCQSSSNKRSKSTKRKTMTQKPTKRKTTKRKTIKRKSTKRKTKTSKKSKSNN